MIKYITNLNPSEIHSSILENEGISLGKLEELWEWRKGRSLVFADTETNTLNYRSGDLLLRQFGDKNIQFVLDWTVDLDNSFYDNATFVFHNAMFDYNQLKRHKVVLRKVYDTMLAMMVLTEGKYTAEYIRDNGPYRFSELVLESTGKELNKNFRIRFSEFVIGKSQLTAEHIKYAAEDVEFLDPAYHYIHEKIVESNLEDCLNLENRYVLAFSDMNYFGVKLNVEQWLELERAKKIELKDMVYDLDESLILDIPKITKKRIENKYWANPDFNQPSLFGEGVKKRKLATNYNSPQQIQMFFKEMGIKVTDKHGKATTSIKQLKKIVNKTAFVKTFISYKELEKRISSFGSNFLEFIDPVTKRIHPRYVTQILDTGRTALKEPNLYQIPQDNAYRNCFIGETRGEWKYFYVGGDYSAQEGRIMAFMANDEAYIEFFNTGDGDAHSFVATKMFSAQYGRDFRVKSKVLKIELKPSEDLNITAAKFIELSKLKSPDFTTEIIDNKTYIVLDVSEKNIWRQNGKILNFFLSFGGSAFTLAMELGIPIAEAESLIKAFFDGFPKLKVMFTRFASFAITNGYSITNQITKRRRYYPEWQDMNTVSGWIEEQKQILGQNFWDQIKDKTSFLSKENRKAYVIKGEIERAGQNTPIQGTAADMTKTACIKLREKLIDNGILPLDGAVIMLVLMPHDEIQCETREDYIDLASELLADAMDEAGQIFVQGISLRPEITVEPYWKK